MTGHEPRGRPRFLGTPLGTALCLLLAIAGVWLRLDHRVYLLAALPLALPLIICGGVHLLMHRGHGGRR